MVAVMYERLPVDAPPEAVVAALRDVLRERGITEYAVGDHGRDMAAAVDIALRLPVIGPDGTSEIVPRDVRTSIDDDTADEFTTVLRRLPAAARDRLASDG